MLDDARRALGARDPAALLVALRQARTDGVLPAELVELGLSHVLGRPLRGSKWTHGLLALSAAASLEARLGAEAGLPAAVSAVHFVAGSEPGPARGTAPPTGSRIGWFEGAIRGGTGGWGHHALVARAGWDLATRFPALGDSIRATTSAHWSPPEPDRAFSEALAEWRSRGLSLPLLATVEHKGPRAREERVAQVLSGDAAHGFGRALADGEPAGDLLAAVSVAAARVCAASPGLRQLHGITVARCMLEFVEVPGLDVRAPVLAAALFVSEGWQLARRSGRLGQDPEPGTTPPSVTSSLEELASLAAPLELTQSWGHPTKLIDACFALRDRLPRTDEAWLVAAVEASAATWLRSQRPWLSTTP